MPIDASRAAGCTTHPSRPAIPPESLRLLPVVQAVSGTICALVLYAALPQVASAQASAAPPVQAGPLRFEIAAGPLAPALRSLASAANLLLSFTEEQTRGRATAGVKGQYTPQEALAGLLAGTGLQAVALEGGGYVLRAVPATAAGAAAPPPGEPATLAPVRVTGRAERASDLPEAYAGEQVARGGRLGMLGNTDVMDAPFNITSYTAGLIENQQAQTVADVLMNDPSVRAGLSSASSAQGLSIRGFPMGDGSVFFDGLAGMAPHARSSVEFVERVEVLKGPSAAIGGMVTDGSVGGTVMLVPKRAGDKPLTRIGVDYGTASRLGTHLDVGRRFGDDKAWGIRINGVLRDGETAVEDQDHRQQIGNLALDYRGERLRASLDTYYKKDRQDGAVYVIRLAGRPGPVTDSSKPFVLGTSTDMRDRMAMGRLEYDITPRLTAFVAYGKHGYKARHVENSPFNVDRNGDYLSSLYVYPNNFDVDSGEVGIRTSFGTGPIRHRLTLTATDYRKVAHYAAVAGAAVPNNIYRPVVSPYPTSPLGDAPQTLEQKLRSFAIADTLSLWNERLLLTLGLRHQQVFTDAVWSSTGPYRSSANSPVVALVFRPAPSLSLYANHIQGLSEGQTAPLGTGLVNAGEVFPPYKSKQYEVGVKGEWDGFGSSVSLFQISRPNALTRDNRFSLDGEQRNRGVEWNVYGTLGSGVRVLGGVTLMDAKVTKAVGTSLGKRAYGIPRRQLNLGGEWDVPGLSGLTLSGRAVHTGSVYIDSDNLYRIPSWTRWDIGARYAMTMAGRPVVLRANVENLLDRDYWTGTRWSAALGRSAPRTLLLSATVDF